jgi:SSS family solute:Na+ symporter
MHLNPTDWILFAASLLLITAVGFSYTRSSSRNLSAFFLGGRNLPWYLAGISMVATTFAADTPLAVADLTGTYGISGNWLWWNMLFGGLLTTFFFARLWRRSGVLTEVELIELRYSGPVAAFLRGFKAVYLGIFLNVLIIGWVSQAMVSIAEVFLGLDRQQALLFTFGLMAFTALYSSFAGLKGIAVTDSIQFVLAMGGTIALAALVLRSPEVGGVAGLRETLPEDAFRFFPRVGGAGEGGQSPGAALSIGLGAFLARIGMQWWASWYPGAEPGGGGYIAQRMMSVRGERDALWSSLVFNLAHYCLRPWPWILVGLAALSLYNLERNLPADALGAEARELLDRGAEPAWLAMDAAGLEQLARDNPTAAELLPSLSAISQELALRSAGDPALRHALIYQGDKQKGYVFAMADFLPPGLRGLLLAAFVAAFMSTISTQLNWGASYVVHDLYARFGNAAPDSPALVWTSRWATLGLMLLSLWVAAGFESITSVWLFIIECGAGLGLVLILRWYWWRINAWSELSATLGSMGYFALARYWELPFPQSFLFIVGATTITWLLFTFLTPAEPASHLEAFCRKVDPGGAWGPVRRAAGLPAPASGLLPLLAAWLAAVALTYSVLFLSGCLLLGNPGALGYGASALLSLLVLVWLGRRFRIFGAA